MQKKTLRLPTVYLIDIHYRRHYLTAPGSVQSAPDGHSTLSSYQSVFWERTIIRKE
jgi:hypothetical protein